MHRRFGYGPGGGCNAILSAEPADPQRVSERLTDLGASTGVAAADAEGELAEQPRELSNLLTNARLELAGGVTGGADMRGGTGGN